MVQCFKCKQEIGRLQFKIDMKQLSFQNRVIPTGMTSEDKVCNKCSQELGKIAKEERKIVNAEKNAEFAKVNDDLFRRSSEYKKHWNKNGIIQYKDDHIAILHRGIGGQVEFIIALSDCTKKGYRLMAIDEGKSGSSGGLTGGIDSYYYLQKKEDIL